MFKLIWLGFAYELILTNEKPDGTWLAVQLEKAQQPPDRPQIEFHRAEIGTLEAQNFGFCLLPAN